MTVAHGTPSELKLQVGGNRLDVTLAPGADLAIASDAVRPFVGPATVRAQGPSLQVRVEYLLTGHLTVARGFDAGADAR